MSWAAHRKWRCGWCRAWIAGDAIRATRENTDYAWLSRALAEAILIAYGEAADVDRLFAYLTTITGRDREAVRQTLLADYQTSGARANPACLQGLLKDREKPLPR